MSQKTKIAKAVITIYDDGTFHIQELHEATTTALTLDDPPPPPPPTGTIDDGGETPTKPPGNP